jgi:hypothetical protein
MKVKILYSIFGFLGACILVVSGYFFWSNEKMVKVHVLEFPLLLSGKADSNTFSLLPAGTVMYYEKSLPEGFSRYRVYINTEKTLNDLQLQTLEDTTMIDPIWADSVQKEDLSKLIADYPITKDELQKILKSPHLTKEEIREVLNDYLRE